MSHQSAWTCIAVINETKDSLQHITLLLQERYFRGRSSSVSEVAKVHTPSNAPGPLASSPVGASSGVGTDSARLLPVRHNNNHFRLERY